MNRKNDGRQEITRKKFNTPLTRRIMELHQEGYALDFIRFDDKYFACVQDNRLFLAAYAYVRLIDLCFNQYNKAFTYVHAIDTFCGEKGMIMAEEILSIHLEPKAAIN